MWRALVGFVRGLLVSLAMLIVSAAALGYLWLNHDRLLQAALPMASPSAAQAVTHDDGAISAKDAISAKEYELFQRQTSDSIQSATQDIAAQQADLKRLSDQVSTLTAHPEAMQSAAAQASPQQTASARPPALAAGKKPPAQKPADRLSAQGVPLPAARAGVQ